MFSTGSPNQGQLQIGIALVLQDRFSNQAREASSQIRRLHNEAKILTNANLNVVKNLTSMGFAAGSAATLGLASVVRQGAEFIDTMTFVDAIATKNGVTMEELSKKSRSLGRDTMFTSQDIASAMQYMAMAGMDTKEIFNNIEAAAHLAGGTMSALGGKGGAADIMTNIMKMFRIESTQMNSTRVADVLTKGVTSANTNLYDLAEAIKYAGTTVTNLGGSLEQTVAFIGVLGNAGIQGSMAGTAMANTYRYLTKSIEDTRFKGHKALKAIGLGREDFIDAKGNLIDMGLAMQKIAKATANLSDTEKFNTLVSILGVRGERGGSTMVRAFEDYSKLLNKVQNEAGGTAASVMNERMETIAGGINKVTSTLENMATTFTQSVAPVITPALEMVAYLFDMISKVLGAPVIGPTISALITFGTLLFTAKMGLLALKATWKLTFNDSTISFANMIAVMKAGWKGASISAAQYQAMEAGIIAQRKAGIVSNTLGAQTFAAGAGMQYIMSNPGQRAGGVFYKKGRFYQETPGKGATGVTRISEAKAVQTLADKTPQELGIVAASPVTTAGAAAATTATTATAASGTKPPTGTSATVVASGTARGGTKPTTGTATAAATTAIGKGLFSKGIFKGLLGVASAGLSLLGGPIGAGLTVLTLALPSIISSLTSNKNATEENTDTLNRDIEDRNRPKDDTIPKVNPLKTLSEEEQRIMITNAINNLAETLKNQPVARLSINIDGKEVITRLIKNNQEESIVNLGAK